LLQGLEPGARYNYRPQNSQLRPLPGLPAELTSDREFSFVMPPAALPVRIGVIGDPGQSFNTTTTLQRLQEAGPDLVWHLGDHSYVRSTWGVT
jgi:hypothetical protein